MDDSVILIQEEPLKAPTPPPEEDNVEPPIPQWAIAVIVIGAASLIFIVLFAAVTIYGRHHMRRRYSSKLSEEDMERSSGEWESKMAAAYENMAADTIYDAEDLHGDSYKKGHFSFYFHAVIYPGLKESHCNFSRHSFDLETLRQLVKQWLDDTTEEEEAPRPLNSPPFLLPLPQQIACTLHTNTRVAARHQELFGNLFLKQKSTISCDNGVSLTHN
ncbi:uncharacterized protein TNCV_3772422 [Trichonephila clavipes]|nr:uncharacterized protein TNCV_3772422 [Trichonephila clavipes]